MVNHIKYKRGSNEAHITEKECFKRVIHALMQNVEISIRGDLSQQRIFEAIVGMASNQDSIHSITQSLEDIPCETSLRHHLKKFDLSVLQKINIQLLTSHAIRILKSKKPYRFAIDFTLDPFYGKKTAENCEYLIRSRVKKSTNEFYGYATLYIINKDIQLTLAILPLRPDHSSAYYVAYFLDVIRSLNLQIEVLCLDRGFYSKKVIKLLQVSEVPHIMPVKRQGKRMKELLSGRGSRFEEYIMKDKKCPVSFACAVVTTYSKGKRKKNKAINYGYVIFRINWNP